MLHSRSPLRWPLVGRVDELEQIARSRDVRAGGVVLFGPPGVGKSRLAREALAEAERSGAVTNWVQATRSAASVPLGAFAGVLPDGVRSTDLLELLQLGLRSLRESARGRPLVLGVDDAHLLDATSAALVLQLALTATAFIVASVRAGEPCPDAITSLCKDGRADRLDLGVLTGDETDALVESIVGGPVEQRARRSIRELSQGNALYIRELVLGALAEDALSERGGLWRMPVRLPVSATLSDLIAARLAGLSRSEHEALELLAVGEPLRVAELIELAGNESLLTMEARGLVEVDDGSAQSDVRLAHPLYGEAIRSSLSTLRARRARLELANALQRRAERKSGDALRIARLLIDADAPIDPPLLLEAARSANLAGDPGLAAELAGRAVQSGGGPPAALVLARAHTIQNQYELAEAVLAAAEPTIDDREAALEYLERQSEVLFWGLNRPDDLRCLLARAESWWPDAEWRARLVPLRLRVASAYGPAAAVATSEEILATAGLDPEVRRKVQAMHAANLLFSGRTREGLELARRIRPVPPLRDVTDELAFIIWSVIALESGESWAELESWAHHALQQGIRLEDRVAAGWGALALGSICYSQGRFADARRWLAEAELQLEYHDAIGLLAITNSLQVGVACFTGDLDSVQPALDACRASLDGRDPLPNQLPYLIRAEAWATHALGDPPRGQQMFLDGAARLSAMPVYAARLTYEAIRIGAPARRLAPQLAELKARCDARLVAAYAAHAAALASDDGRELLAIADEMESIGALRYATEAAAHAASALAREGRQDSARRAAARCHELLARGQGGIPPLIDGVDTAAVSLTKREAQLVQLASRGLTNAQIADQLVLSVRTVESHLYRAMQKLGVSDRHEL